MEFVVDFRANPGGKRTAIASTPVQPRKKRRGLGGRKERRWSGEKTQEPQAFDLQSDVKTAKTLWGAWVFIFLLCVSEPQPETALEPFDSLYSTSSDFLISKTIHDALATNEAPPRTKKQFLIPLSLVSSLKNPRI